MNKIVRTIIAFVVAGIILVPGMYLAEIVQGSPISFDAFLVFAFFAGGALAVFDEISGI